MSNWLKLEGDVCAVTGALGGMGVEICREFARNGANVVRSTWTKRRSRPLPPTSPLSLASTPRVTR